MSIQEKMIAALIDASTITKKDFSSKLFKGLFNENINEPSLDNHIFLLFKYDLSAESINRDKRFLSSPNIYKSEFVKIDNENYVLYTFCILNLAIRAIMTNSMAIDADDLIKIYKFWKFEDEDINRYAITQKVTSLFKDISVPEYDYQPDWEDVFKTKKVGLSI